MNSRVYPGVYVGVLAALLFFFGLGWRDFWAPVEPRYAEIARVMFLKGEWIVPTVNGDLYTDKPILYFWMVLIGAKIFGAVNEWTVRLPAALGGVGFLLATYFMARDFLSARTGVIAAALLATSMRVIWEARWAHVDMLFCACFVLAVYFAARALLRRGKPNEILLAYVFVALATLTKGLIGIVLPGLIFTAFVLVRRDWRMIGAAKLHWGILIFLLVAGPWFYLVSRATNGKWLADFIYIHHIQRYTAGAGHRQPFYYYLTTLPADFLPWTIFLFPALLAYRPYRSRCAEPRAQFFLLWFLSVFVFFTLSDTKRDLYLLPLMPTLALFIGKYFDDLSRGALALDSIYCWLTMVFFGMIAGAGIALAPAAWLFRPDALAQTLPASIALFVGATCAIFFARRRRPLAVITSVVAMMAANVLCAALWIMPSLETFKSPRPFSRQVMKIVPAAAPLYVYADTMNDFNFYMARDVIPVLPNSKAVDAVLARHEGGYLLIKERDLRRLPQLPREWIVVSDEKGSATWYLMEMRASSAPQVMRRSDT